MFKLISFAFTFVLLSAPTWAQAPPTPYAASSLALVGTDVSVAFLKNDRLLLNACTFRKRCEVKIFSVSQEKLDRLDSRWLDYAEASYLLAKISKVNRSECSGKVDSVADAMAFAETCTMAASVAVKKIMKARPPKGFIQSITVGNGDQLVLFSVLSRKLPFGQRLKENIGNLISLGMGAAGEWDNHQEILVAHTSTGKVCADWHFASDDVLSAAVDISPSGKFVARFLGGRLSIYPTPETCGVS